MYDEAAEDDEGFWAAPGGRAARLVDGLGHDLRVGPAVRQVVRRRPAQRHPQLPRPPRRRRARRQGRHPLRGRARRHPRRSRTPSCSTRCSASPTRCKGLGVQSGDRVNIYLPMIPEAAVAMLACARIGAAHSVVFGGFSSQALAGPHQRRRGQGADHRRRRLPARRGVPAEAGGRRGGGRRRRRSSTSSSSAGAATTSTMQEGRDHWYHDLVEAADAECPAEPFDAEQLLFLLYTSGTTGKPKGIMHTTGGYLTQVAFTHKYVFDLHPETDVYWCTADVGWVTGHSYIVYGPLANGATIVMYEGVPNHPGQRPVLVDHREVRRHDLLHRADGDPHVHEVGRRGAGQARPVEPAGARHGRRADQPRGVDVVPRAHRRRALPDRRHVVADRDRRDHDQPAARGDHDQAGLGDVPAARHRRRGRRRRRRSRSTRGGGYLTLTRPWPGMLRGIWGDPERYQETYWSRFPDRYFAGDGAKLDDDGYLWLLGRVDDVMNVSGHRISTTEVESALVVAPRGRRGRRRRRHRRHHRAGDHRLRHAARRVRRRRRRRCATTSARRSAPSPSRRRST